VIDERPIDPAIVAACGSVESVIEAARAAWRPPPKLTLSEWADQNFVLSAESSAQPGKWSTLPYQREIMDAFTDRRVTKVSVMKSARVGWTKIVNAVIGFSIHQDPCPITVVQPTVEDSKGYSKEEVAPMLRDTPCLAKIVFEDQVEEAGPRDSGNTILHKKFPGGLLSLVGANSGAGFRRVSRKRMLFDEVDAYPPSAGQDGDPVKLGTKRTEYFWDRKIGLGSTPLIAGYSRIETEFLDGDQRRYYVPCPQCGHEDYFVFTQDTKSNRGHFMQWPEGHPEQAHFVCSKNGCVIEHKDKREMVTRGRWVAHAPFKDHASFHIWAAYSFSPNATWANLAQEFLDAKKLGPEGLKTFVNTALGETWKEAGEAPDWERIYLRRETYPIGVVPPGVLFMTIGVDVQKDRFVYEVVGWGHDRESWSVDYGVIPGDTAKDETWLQLDELLERKYPLGHKHPDAPDAYVVARLLAIDSGYNANQVYNWGRRHERNRVIAVKGMASARTLLTPPTAVDVTHREKRIARGYKVWPVGVDIAKSELYGWLRLDPPIPEEGKPVPLPPAGFCHFPQYDQEFFKQLTAEQLVTVRNKRTGRQILEWHVLPNRENHVLDCRVYARVAAAIAGIDRLPSKPRAAAPAPVDVGQGPKPAPPPPKPPETSVAAPKPPPAPQRRPIPDSTFWRGRGRSIWNRR
jgi:phage terminase large subunit GpA-like protein